MKFTNYYKLMPVCLLIGSLCCPFAATASETDALNAMLQQFLLAAHQEQAHRTFWADDLVYTASNGTRTNKARILAGFSDAGPSDEPPVVYSGEDVDIRIYGSTAVIAFRLVGRPSDGSPTQYYLNTGTFLKRDDTWQAVAWQATRVGAIQDTDE